MSIKQFFVLFLYLFTQTIYGAVFIYVGSLIPYMAEATGLSESSFTIIVMIRGVGYIIGGFIKLKFMPFFDIHRGLALGCFGSGLGYTLFSFCRIYFA